MGDAEPAQNQRFQAVLYNELKNAGEYDQPLTSFDWNKNDVKTIATASLDSSVTLWDIE